MGKNQLVLQCSNDIKDKMHNELLNLWASKCLHNCRFFFEVEGKSIMQTRHHWIVRCLVLWYLVNAGPLHQHGPSFGIYLILLWRDRLCEKFIYGIVDSTPICIIGRQIVFNFRLWVLFISLPNTVYVCLGTIRTSSVLSTRARCRGWILKYTILVPIQVTRCAVVTRRAVVAYYARF